MATVPGSVVKCVDIRNFFQATEVAADAPKVYVHQIPGFERDGPNGEPAVSSNSVNGNREGGMPCCPEACAGDFKASKFLSLFV